MDALTDREQMAKGTRAQKVLEAEEYVEAWTVYRQRIFEAFENAKSDDVDTIMQLKRLLTSAAAARKHLEALMVDGQVAAKSIELAEKKPFLKRVLG